MNNIKKGSIHGSLKDGYEINGNKVSNSTAIAAAESSDYYETYYLQGKKVIRSIPDNSLKDNVNN